MHEEEDHLLNKIRISKFIKQYAKYEHCLHYNHCLSLSQVPLKRVVPPSCQIDLNNAHNNIFFF
jgi:hypothetical protein